MPLPAALLARLKKRGIIKGGRRTAGGDGEPADESHGEEVIAESYDDDGAEGRTRRRLAPPLHAIGCPNKYNAYHLCNQYCFDRYDEGSGVPESRLSKRYLALKKAMLAKYPLPDGWKEVYDAGVAHHYYWNPDSNEVCWVSPTHPKAVIGEPAPQLAKSYFDRIERSRLDALLRATATSASKRQAHALASGGAHADDDDDSDDDDKVANKRRRGGRQNTAKDHMDPMDPASYGECEPGKWSSGLDMRGEAKTGVDVTASGPLFQSRPYPNPGAILRQNAEIKK